MNVKKKVLFVGAFNTTTTNVGGQLFACTSLIKSNLSEVVDWHLIDTTAETNQQRSVWKRFSLALTRMVSFVRSLLRFRPSTVLIFFAHRGSFLEKGLMAVFAKCFNKRVIMCGRSGLLINDIKTSRFWRNYARFIFRLSDKVVCQSDTWKNFFIEQLTLSTTKYVVIHNWIDFDKYQDNFVHQQLRKPSSHAVILFMGWVTRDKGIFDLLKAYRAVSSTQTRLVIAGDGEHLDEAKKETRHLKIETTTEYLGWVFNADKQKLLKEADLFVLPSYYEGLPNALLEAMASGVPVIATSVGGIPDLIRDGESGFLVAPGNAHQLAEKINVLLGDARKRKAFSLMAYDYIKSYHSLQAAVSSFKEIL